MARLALLLVALVAFTARPAHALFHFSVIDELHATAEDGEGFVEIRMLAGTQNFVSHSRLSAWNCDGSFKGIALEVPSDVTNQGANVRWIMATSSAAIDGITADFSIPVGSLPLGCGMVCWGAPGTLPPNPPTTWDATQPTNYVDCVAYGPYTGTNVPLTAGTPTSLTASNPTLSLTRTGNTSNNSNDFALSCPTPTNNAGATGGAVCTTTTTLLETTTSTTETTTSTTLLGATTTTSTTESTTSSTAIITTTSSSSSSTSSTSSSSSTSTSSTSTTAPPAIEHLLTGKLLLLKLKPGKPAKSALAMASQDPATGVGLGNGSEHDPTVNGGGIRLVSSAAGAFDQSYPLAGSWKYVGKAGQNKGYKWKSKGGPITSVVLKHGKLLQIAGHGAGLGGVTLGVDPKPVRVVVSLGTLRICLEFGGTTKWVNGKSYKGTNAPAPSACR